MTSKTGRFSVKGQWIGGYTGSASGLILVDADETEEGFEGYALLDIGKPQPKPYIRVKTASKTQPLHFSSPVLAVVDGQFLHPDILKSSFPDTQLPMSAEVSVEWDTDSLRVRWTTDAGGTGYAELPRSEADQPSTLEPLVMNWREFKEHVGKLGHRRHVFRGQERSWRLRTGYHRTGRANLERFMAQDVQALHKHLSARTKHYFNLQVADQNGAFLNLIQHHGYPTPILDWTYSPYVAAYFAFASVNKVRADAAEANDRVRVFVINKDACLRIFPPIPILTMFGPHFSFMEFSAVENERMIPQQALSAVSTIDDIETYLMNMAGSREANVLSCIDLPASERRLVMTELAMMGITAGSLFPGLDGACRELRERFFDSVTD